MSCKDHSSAIQCSTHYSIPVAWRREREGGCTQWAVLGSPAPCPLLPVQLSRLRASTHTSVWFGGNLYNIMSHGLWASDRSRCLASFVTLAPTCSSTPPLNLLHDQTLNKFMPGIFLIFFHNWKWNIISWGPAADLWPLKIIPTPNSYAGTRSPNVTVFGNRTYKEVIKV
jgi:hypothetical protein